MAPLCQTAENSVGSEAFRSLSIVSYTGSCEVIFLWFLIFKYNVILVYLFIYLFLPATQLSFIILTGYIKPVH